MATHTHQSQNQSDTPAKSSTSFFDKGQSNPFFQAKLTVNTPGDAHEQEADAVADQVMRMKTGDAPIVQRTAFTPVSSVQRACAACEHEREHEKEGIQRKETSGGDASGKAAPSVVSDVLSSGGGQPMDGGTKQFMESRFGQDFSQVRIHTDVQAAESASAIQARAYTSGRDVVFGKGEYQPESEGGRSLLAHELVHVGQQQREGMQMGIQRKPAAGFKSPLAIIPIKKFINYVKAVEAAYPKDNILETLTRIRMMYYGEFKFRQLIIDAPDTETITDTEPLSTYNSPWTTLENKGRESASHQRERKLYKEEMDETAYYYLTSQANENSTTALATQGDNPSPYIQLENGQEIDVGHLFLALEARAHPTTTWPFSTFGVPNIDPAAHVADLGIAVVWVTSHEKNNEPSDDAPPKAATLKNADWEKYYDMSAPEQDLLGDVDAFSMTASSISLNAFKPDSGKTLSELVECYYLNQKDNKYSVNKRWINFITALGWKYSNVNGVINFDKSVRDNLLQRVRKFCDLYGSGNFRTALTTFGIIPIGLNSLLNGPWKHVEDVVDKFLAFVIKNLEKEISTKTSHEKTTPSKN